MSDWREHPETVAWRPGGRVVRTVYAVQPNRAHYQTDHDVLIGMLDSGRLSVTACMDHNRAIGVWPPVRADERGGTRAGTEADWSVYR